MKRAIYAGSFDPVTNGHFWVIEQASQLFDEVIVAIAVNPDKKYMFSESDKISMLKEVTKDLKNVQIKIVGNQYLIDFAIIEKANYLVRGVRGAEDLPLEKTMLHFNNEREPQIQSIFLIPPKFLEDVSSSLVRGLVGFKGWRTTVDKYVHPFVLKYLKIKWLEKQWYKLMKDIPASAPDVRFQHLISSYGDEKRYYHNLDHLINCLELMEECRDLSENPHMIEYALWYHDKWEGRENGISESQDSATCLLKLNDDNKEYIKKLIQITDHSTDTCGNIDFQLIKDIDLSILGFPKDKYEEYTQAVRKEYSHIEDKLFKPGRAAILQKFLDMPRIYQTDYFYERFEKTARENLETEIKSLLT